MAVTTFAAIDIGSYNISMEIFEVRRSGLTSLTMLQQRLLLDWRLGQVSSQPLEKRILN